MSIYRSHLCSDLSINDLDKEVTLSGWIDTKRDHGNLLFIDLRDNYGITQCVIDAKNSIFNEVSNLNHETVIKVIGKVVKRSKETINNSLKTGQIEVEIVSYEVLSNSEILPLPVNSDIEYGEEVRLKYRYLDLRRNKLHNNIILRNKVISSIRKKMIERGFVEFQTPILTSTSPEGARDYLVPSRIHHGQFYALPQAPQQFKQLLMIAGFDKYFQIAPCFRDEDSRADRSPGEFYQLDFEMSFVTQEDVFDAIEPVLYEIFEENIHLKLKQNLNLKNLLNIIVPRNIKRADKIKKEIKSYVPLTEQFQSKSIGSNTEIIIDNSIGQLEMWYKNVKTVFLGKSYPPKGGQNPIEPARNGCAIVSGKMSNFKEIEKEMLLKKCLIRANKSSEFYSKIEDCIKKKNYIKSIRINAKKYVKSKSFVLDKTVKIIQKYLV